MTVRSHRILSLSVAALLGLASALLVSSCGSTGAGLIPAGNAGPLQGDFETIAQAAETGDGSCSATKAAVRKTEQDFHALPASVNSGLRDTLKQGIDNLRTRALVLCSQPLAQTTTTSAAPKTPAPSTHTTPPEVTQTATTPSTPAVTTPATTTPAGGGGTAAPNPSETPAGAPSGPGGGTGVGESGAAGAGAPGSETPAGGAGAQEGAK